MKIEQRFGSVRSDLCRVEYLPDSMEVLAGVLEGGVVTDTHSPFPDKVVVISEEIEIPAIDVRFTFEAVEDINLVQLHARHDGLERHSVLCQLLNPNTLLWRRLFNLWDQSVINIINFDLHWFGPDFIDSLGNVVLRIYHESRGNPADRLHIGHVSLHIDGQYKAH